MAQSISNVVIKRHLGDAQGFPLFNSFGYHFGQKVKVQVGRKTYVEGELVKMKDNSVAIRISHNNEVYEQWVRCGSKRITQFSSASDFGIKGIKMDMKSIEASTIKGDPLLTRSTIKFIEDGQGFSISDPNGYYFGLKVYDCL